MKKPDPTALTAPFRRPDGGPSNSGKNRWKGAVATSWSAGSAALLCTPITAGLTASTMSANPGGPELLRTAVATAAGGGEFTGEESKACAETAPMAASTTAQTSATARLPDDRRRRSAAASFSSMELSGSLPELQKSDPGHARPA